MKFLTILSTALLPFALLGFQKEKERNEIFNVEINGTYPHLTGANQLIFYLGSGQGFFSPKLYNFSTHYVVMAPYTMMILGLLKK